MNFHSLSTLKYSLTDEKELVYRKLCKADLNCLNKFLVSQGKSAENLDAKVIDSCLIRS
jgi:hypothetical protein